MATTFTPVVYGISQCDTVKKARNWLQENGVAYTWHDFKKQGLTPEVLQQWLHTLGREALLNRKGTTWRRLDEAAQACALADDAGAAALMLAQHSVIKRPLVDWGNGQLTLGFDPQQWRQLLAAHASQ